MLEETLMETIHRSLEGAPLPDIRVCRHLAALADSQHGSPLRGHVSCANCGGHLCGDCEDDAGHCSAGVCLGLICADCLATARKRKHITGPDSPARVIDGL